MLKNHPNHLIMIGWFFILIMYNHKVIKNSYKSGRQLKNDFGFRLILACHLRNMSAAELKEKCSYAAPLLAYCIQLDCPTLHLVYDLAEILDVSVLWLMGFNVDYENK